MMLSFISVPLAALVVAFGESPAPAVVAPTPLAPMVATPVPAATEQSILRNPSDPDATDAPALPSQATIDATGAGLQLGIEEIHASGQVGTVTFLRRPNNMTAVVVSVRGEPAGRIEPLAILRGKSCTTIEPKMGWQLNPIVGGRSTTLIHAPISKITSGNYVIVAHADDHKPGHNVACGELYQ